MIYYTYKGKSAVLACHISSNAKVRCVSRLTISKAYRTSANL